MSIDDIPFNTTVALNTTLQSERSRFLFEKTYPVLTSMSLSGRGPAVV